jgi:hypothetical protein
LNFNYIAWSTGANTIAKVGMPVEVINTTSAPVNTKEVS